MKEDKINCPNGKSVKTFVHDKPLKSQQRMDIFNLWLKLAQRKTVLPANGQSEQESSHSSFFWVKG